MVTMAVKEQHKPKDRGSWPHNHWVCSCGWRPTKRSIGISRGYTDLTAVRLHIAQKEGRLCNCGCELDIHVAGHGACKGETRYMGAGCPCVRFVGRRRS